MKNLLFIFSFTFLLIIISCHQSSVANSEMAIEVNAVNDNKIRNSQMPTSSPSPIRSPDVVKITPEYPLLWRTAVTVNDFNNSEKPLELYSYDENQSEKPTDKKSPYYQARSGIEVDLMNCGGYLASGRIYSSDEKSNFPQPNWRLKIEAATIAKDVESRIKKCSPYVAEKSAEDVFSSEIFAVAPRKETRKNITIGDVDTKKLFRSLPQTVQNSLNHKSAIEAGRVKDDLSIDRDNWTDLDGDGEIDLINVSVPNEKQSQGIVLLLTKGKWTIISRTQPA